MRREDTRSDLAEQVQRLEATRQQHMVALAQIDQLLSRIGEALRNLHVAQPRGGADQSADLLEGFVPSEAPLKKEGPRRYRKAALTGEQAVLAFVRRQGSATTAEINRQWRIEGRGGVANNAILQLLRRGELVREPIPGRRRGSQYRAGVPSKGEGSVAVPHPRVEPSMDAQLAGSRSGG